MKTEVVRARIEAGLKAEAEAVLAASGLEMSDAIRLFLRQLVRVGGLPFPVKGDTRVVSGKRLREMKRSRRS
jgi:DNA-damage-inducible protein J